MPNSSSHPQPVVRISIKLRVSRTNEPISTLTIKNIVRTFISFICNSYWKWIFYHCDDFEISHLRVVFIILSIIGRNIFGTLITSWLLESTVIRIPTIMSKTDKLLNIIYLISFIFSEAPIFIHIISAGYCAQLTIILLPLSLKCV